MKIIVELDSRFEENEIKITCKERTKGIEQIEEYIKKIKNDNFVFYKNNQEYYFSLNDIIFFETNDNSISAHTINDVYNVKYKLYELEKILPKNFIRISKSAIVNINHIFSISKNLASSSIIEFRKTYKKIYVSRFYFKKLKERIKEKI